MAKKHISGELEEKIEPVCTMEDIAKMQKEAGAVYTSDAVLEYIRNIMEQTRNDGRFVVGASPRAFLALADASKAKAYIEGRDFVKPDDVKAVAISVLAHRLKLTGEARIKAESLEKTLWSLVLAAKIPMEA